MVFKMEAFDERSEVEPPKSSICKNFRIKPSKTNNLLFKTNNKQVTIKKGLAKLTTSGITFLRKKIFDEQRN